MSNRIYYGKNTPLSFRESLSFGADAPYKIRYKAFVADDIAPPHYIDALELLVCCAVTGAVTMEGRRIELTGDIAAVAIPPGIVHAVQVDKCPGYMYVVHISLAELACLVDIAALLKLRGKKLPNIKPVCPQPEQLLACVEDLIQNDHDPLARTRILLAIFEALDKQIPPGNAVASAQNRELQAIINWTEANFHSPITLEQAAHTAGFSKNYFCAWFKANTGMTYKSYVNHFRIDHACRMLEKGNSAAEACYASGFSDLPYFTQLFKRIRGCTPSRYKNSLA